NGARCDAVIAANDAMAIGCIDAARGEFGLSVPNELSIVGFDGIGPARFDAYDLTTVRQPIGRMTAAAAEMLVHRIEDPEMLPEHRVFSGEHVLGSSARIQR
ncbi:MAG: substrate-binding domain-containing protein, partial [Pseudomonadota bacterium]